MMSNENVVFAGRPCCAELQVIAVSPVFGQKRSILLSNPPFEGRIMQSFTQGDLVWCPTEGSSLERKKGLAEWAEWGGSGLEL